MRLPLICSLFKGKEVQNVELPYLDVKYLRGNKKQELVSKGCLLKKDDFVILVDGENSGEVFKIKEEGIMGSTFRQLLISSEINENYVLYFLKYYQTLLRENKRGAAIPHLDKHIFGNLLFGLPPLKEQILIVANIEKIFEQIEVVKENQEELSKLKDGLKNKILDLAIQGKLVEQDPNDEPASELLKKIKAEKAELVKQGKIKKDKQESYIFKGDDNRHYEQIGSETKDITDEIPFEIPNNWKWCRMVNITKQIHYGYTASAKSEGCAKLLRITDIQNNSVSWNNVPFCDISLKDLSNYKLELRDILIARTGGTVGKSYIIKEINSSSVFASYLIRLIPVFSINEDYIKLFLESPLYWKQLKEKSMGTGQPNVNGEALKSLLIPIPPITEQSKIVRKITAEICIINSLQYPK